MYAKNAITPTKASLVKNVAFLDVSIIQFGWMLLFFDSKLQFIYWFCICVVDWWIMVKGFCLVSINCVSLNKVRIWLSSIAVSAWCSKSSTL